MRTLNLTRFSRTILTAAFLLPAAAWAQATQTTQAPRPAPIVPAPAIPRAVVDSFTPPLSPRRAFLYSLLLPGSAQSILGRHKAGAAFVFVEALTLGMIRESAADVHEARRLAGDSTVISYVDNSGNALILKAPRQFDDTYIQAREAHVEDWIALLVANHLFAGADAFVAAHLWDVPARLAVRMLPRGGATISASLSW
jgi:hypothetical protein